jgi:hypothetical protein
MRIVTIGPEAEARLAKKNSSLKGECLLLMAATGKQIAAPCRKRSKTIRKRIAGKTLIETSLPVQEHIMANVA